MRNLHHMKLKEVESSYDQDYEMDEGKNRLYKHDHSESTFEHIKFKVKDCFYYVTGTNTRKAILLTCIFLFFLALTLTVAFTTQSKKPKIPSLIYDDLKLPSWIRPVQYFSLITTYMQNSTFTGNIVITVNITERKDNFIVIHGDEFQLNSVYLTPLNNVNYTYPDSYAPPSNAIVPDKITFDKNNTYYVLQFDKLSDWLSKGNQYFNIYMSYNSTLTNDLKGYYLSRYDEVGGIKKTLAMTQFEPTDARLTFPCFDEPAMKANWTIWMNVDSDYQALSNMEPISNSTANGRTLVKFATTPKISTYLICIITHQYTFRVGTATLDNGRSIIVRIWSSYLQQNQTEYPLDAAIRSIKYYTNYFNIEYPLPKMDIIGVSDFAAGAMENWGLITFRNTDVFYSNLTASVESKQRVSEVIAHEIAHQWFGNLVTMKWWNDLWLNEGFATFMSYKCLGSVFPEFNSAYDFLNLIKLSGLSMDSGASTHPISNNFVKVIDIQASFDSVTYDKGASVLSMLDSIMQFNNKDYFQIGIRNYLNKFQYSNAETADLWKELSEATSGAQNISAIMQNWVTEPGLPYVNITQTNGDQVSLSQHRFIDTLDTVSNSTTVWQIPISVRTSCSVDNSTMKDSKSTLQVSLNKCNYALFNNYANAFARFHYDNPSFDALSAQMKLNLSSLDMLGVIEFLDDQFSFVKNGMLDPVKALEMTGFLTTNDNIPTYIVQATVNGMSFIGNNLVEQECYPEYRKLTHSYFDKIMQGFNYTDPGTTYAQLVSYKALVSLSNSAGMTQAIEFLNNTWHQLKSTPELINPNIRKVMYTSIISNGGYNEYDWVLTRFLNSTNNNEKTEALIALGSARQPYLIKRSLDMFKKEMVRTQDYNYLMRSLAMNSYALDKTWDYFRGNYDFFESKLMSQQLGQVVNTIGEEFDSNIKLTEFINFVKGKPKIPQYYISATEETVNNHIKWTDRNTENICSYLKKLYPRT